MGKKDKGKKFELIGFTYSSPEIDIHNPAGALVYKADLSDIDKSSKGAIAGIVSSIVSIEKFKIMVSENQVSSIVLNKSGKLQLSAIRDTHINQVANDVSIFTGECVGLAAGSAGAIATLDTSIAAANAAEAAILASAASASSAGAIATTAVVKGTTVAAEVVGATTAAAASTAGATTASVAYGAIAMGIPMAIFMGTTYGAIFGGATLYKAITKDKLFEYTLVRFVQEHVEKASVADKSIAMCLSGISKKKGRIYMTICVYGKDVPDYIAALKQTDVDGSVVTPNGNTTVIAISFDDLLKYDVQLGYNLMFNTHILLGEDKYKLVKKGKIPADKIDRLCSRLTSITNASLEAIGDVEFEYSNVEESISTNEEDTSTNEVEASRPTGQVALFCKCNEITETYFWENEADNFCKILGCSKDQLDTELAMFVQ